MTTLKEAIEEATGGMSFKESLKFLNIEDYGERIFHSNSHGELFHLYDYPMMAKNFKLEPEMFRPLFMICVEFAEKNWSRPESCFQHMPELMRQAAKTLNEMSKRRVRNKRKSGK